MQHALRLTEGVAAPQVAFLGLTYKPGTNTLRRSTALAFGKALVDQGFAVTAFDPVISELPPDAPGVRLARSVGEALAGADVAIVATAWPEFRKLGAEVFANVMRSPRVIDQAGILPTLADDSRVEYVAVGCPVTSGRAR